MRKPITADSIDADIKNYGAAVRSISPDEYELLERAYDVREIHDRNAPLQNGRRMCRITRRK